MSRMRKVITFIATALIASALTAYGMVAYQGSQMAAPDVITISAEDSTVDASKLCVDVTVNGDGYYSLMSDVELSYYNGELSSILIDDPVLLAFQVSSEHNGGVWLMNLDEGQSTIAELTETVNELQEKGESELAERIRQIVDTLMRCGPYTHEST